MYKRIFQKNVKIIILHEFKCFLLDQNLSPLILLASCKSFVMMVTLFAWIAHKFVSSNNDTKYASAAYCKANTAWLWNLTYCLYYIAISRTKRWKGNFLINKSVWIIKKNYALLVLSDFSQGNSSWFETMWLFHTSSHRGGFSGNFLCNKLFSWYFLCSWLSCSLFCSCHFKKIIINTNKTNQYLYLEQNSFIEIDTQKSVW